MKGFDFMKKAMHTWNRTDYKVETNDGVIESIKKNNDDITESILGKNNTTDKFITALVNAMMQRQISLNESDLNLDSITFEEAHLEDAVRRARANA